MLQTMASKCFIILLCVVAAALTAETKETYTDKYDNINIKEILENKRLLEAYVDCGLDRGKCTPEGKELKDHLKEAMENGCEKCTEKQKNGTIEVIQHLIEHELDSWNELCNKFDPEGKWRKHYEDRARANGINIPK